MVTPGRSPHRTIVKAAAALVVIGLSGAIPIFPGRVAASATADVWATLARRPLHLPALRSGRACPVSRARVAHSLAPEFGFLFVLGRGPAYPLGFDARSTLTNGGRPPTAKHGWRPYKVLWAVSPRYRGPVLVRGHQLGGPNALRFDTGSPIAVQFAFLADGNNSGGWSAAATYTWTRSPGCYAYQVDGTSFSRIIVFRALATR
jgi:hypothetical protein